LANLDQYITVEESKQLLAETEELKKVQSTDDPPEALNKIPHLDISDLDKKLYTPPLNVYEDLFDSGVTALEHEVPFTNGIAYIDFAIDISNIPFNDVVLLPLFCRLLREAGTKGMNDIRMQYQVDRTSGGITVYPVIEEVVQTNGDGNYVVPNGKHFVTKIVVNGACIAATSCLPMLNLFRHILWDSDVQNKVKAMDLLEEMIDDYEDDIQINGHRYTTMRIASRYSVAGFIREQMGGLTQLFQMRRALAQAKGDFTDLALRLVKMQDAMVRGNRNGMVLSVVGDQPALKDLKGAVELFLKDVLPLATQSERFPDFATTEHPWVPQATHQMETELSHESTNQAIIVPTRVNHVGKGGLLFDIGERVVGADSVVTSYLGGSYLYDQLRFNLGALHAWAVLDSDSGVMIYQSSGDPNILETLSVYENGATWLWQQVRDGEMPVEAKAAIVGAIGRLDSKAMQPNLIGFNSILNYLKKDTDEMRQRWRDQILSANPDDIMAMVERLGAWGAPSVVAVTSSDFYNTIDPLDLNMTRCEFSGYQC
jgi:Zn-dependent M16 (insulinase) family peptidase